MKPDILLVDFHRIIQTTMGWTNSHLHLFFDGLNEYAPMEFEIEGAIDSRKVKLNKILKEEKAKILYEYDFGDGWEHDIILEKIVPNAEGQHLPLCLTGKNNCPPEDVGGVWGYAEMLEILENKDHEEYEEYLEWLGGEFDPKYFDKTMVNELLKSKDYGCFWL